MYTPFSQGIPTATMCEKSSDFTTHPTRIQDNSVNSLYYFITISMVILAMGVFPAQRASNAETIFIAWRRMMELNPRNCLATLFTFYVTSTRQLS